MVQPCGRDSEGPGGTVLWTRTPQQAPQNQTHMNTTVPGQVVKAKLLHPKAQERQPGQTWQLQASKLEAEGDIRSVLAVWTGGAHTELLSHQIRVTDSLTATPLHPQLCQVLEEQLTTVQGTQWPVFPRRKTHSDSK